MLEGRQLLGLLVGRGLQEGMLDRTGVNCQSLVRVLVVLERNRLVTALLGTRVVQRVVVVDLLILLVGVVRALAALERVRGDGALLVEWARVVAAAGEEGWREFVEGELRVLGGGVLADVLLDHFAGV